MHKLRLLSTSRGQNFLGFVIQVYLLTPIPLTSGLALNFFVHLMALSEISWGLQCIGRDGYTNKGLTIAVNEAQVEWYTP